MAGNQGTPPNEPTPPSGSGGAGATTPPGASGASTAAAQIGELLGSASARIERLVRDPARRTYVIGGAVGLVLIVALLASLPALTRRGTPAAPPAAEQTAPPAEGQPAPAQGEQPAPAPGEQPAPPAGEQPAPTPAAPPSLLRSYFLSALPLLLGLFWLLSAWLVDSEARRAFVVQEPWGERRTIAYTTLAVGCVFPLILAGLIFSAWGFVTFILDVSRRQSPSAALEAAALMLVAAAGFLVLRGLLARWMDQRRAARRL